MRRTMKDDEEKEQEESSDARLGFVRSWGFGFWNPQDRTFKLNV